MSVDVARWFARREVITDVKQVHSYRNDTLSYVSLLNDCEDCDTLVYVHGGLFSLYDLYDVSENVHTISKVYGMRLISVDYRQIAAGARFDDMVDDVATAWDAARKRWASVRAWYAAGYSGGGFLVQAALARGALRGTAGAILDASLFCAPKYDADLRAAPFAVFDGLPQTPLNPFVHIGDVCFDAAPVLVPTFAMQAVDDALMPVAQMRRRFRGIASNNASLCEAEYGFHGGALTAECTDRFEAWLRSTGGQVAPTRPWLLWQTRFGMRTASVFRELFPGTYRTLLCRSDEVLTHYFLSNTC